ncbi:phosphate acyltransferase PlsX [Limisphaera ngatamarikiensis]|uniref:Phosphate acyltransferase n=1 Tax=Limisphaera ngatamarikiensis TaxID=1324935 RepID=A0A6M1RIS8_9BACT|nr:phosphate acyltransferase PlsX [Limisphaera ngatamarikiensis]NGO39616.1 phosphate acyltransferase PlsX [Limisphaera ngatamarikiensis]
MRVAVDVMGGDHGPGVVIGGLQMALRSGFRPERVYLVGRRQEIEQKLREHDVESGALEIVHASEVLTMEDRPVQALRRKPDCSILRAMELVAEGRADAVISMGNTGGIFAAATLKLGRLPGVDRGAIAAVIPTPERAFVLVDAGANIECKPLHLVQYAVMGSVYAREVLRASSPRVGLMNVGREDGKGNELTQEAFRLLRRTSLNFVGNVEGHDLFEDRVDVVVCDGFVGNVILKTCESLALAMFGMLKRELSRNLRRRLGAILAGNAFRTLRRRLDPEAYGGAPLLGFRGTVMKVHGSARERAWCSALLITAQTLQHHVRDQIAQQIAEANAVLENRSAASASTLP